MNELNTSDFEIRDGVLQKYRGVAEEVIIPEGTIAIMEKAFNYSNTIKRVVIPEGVKRIEKYAFYKCKNLQNVKISESITYIEKDAFYTGSFDDQKIEFDVPEKSSNATSNFYITNGVLNEYKGPGGKVIVPANVTDIGKYAFSCCSTLTSVTIQEGVKTIGQGAFSECRNLTMVNIPESITDIGDYAFSYCTNLTEIIIPEGVKSIGVYGFHSCKNLKYLTIPNTVTSIKHSAFDSCYSLTKIVIPKSATNIGNNIFNNCRKLNISFENGYLCRPIKLPALSVSEIINPKSCAYAMIYQNGKIWDTAIEKHIQVNNDKYNAILTDVIGIIRDNPKETVAKKAIEAALHYIDMADTDLFKQLYSILFKMKFKCLKMLIEDPGAQLILLDGKLDPEGITKDNKKKHPIEEYVNEHWIASETTRKLKKIITKGVPYADSEELSSPEAVIMVISSYADQIDESIQYYSLYETSFVHTYPDEIADHIAASLDKEKLQELLEDLAFNKRYEKDWYLLPFGRYASPAQITKLNVQMRAWANWGKYSATGRKNIIVGRGALMLSDTREAIMAVDKAKALDYYARIRKTDADTLRDTVLSEFGFDSVGTKKYDLGGNTAVISLKEDLSLSIYDENAGKVVKSIPKKGSNEELYDFAKKDFSDLKKNIKRVVTNRRKLLFEAFLSENGFQPASWKRAYLDNPVLKALASLIIWQQKDAFFTCDRAGKLILSDGEQYLLDDGAIITVAHPMNMSLKEIDSWQRYFNNRDLKQPFEQIWEPVYKADDIKEDRYKGCVLPVYRFAGKQAHGIDVLGYGDYSEDFGFSLKDCELETTTDMWRFTHQDAQESFYELGSFKVTKFSRYANHIIYLLDKWTIEERILKNDSTIGDVLDGFTVAQLLEFIKMASDKNSTDSLAVLMDFKDKKYQNIDPMAKFTLD